jgi:TPR repeat protein
MSNNDPHDRSMPIPKSSLKSLALKYATEVAAAYGQLIEESPVPFYRPESQLPYSKAEIRECIELLLSVPLDARRQNGLECLNVILNDFIPDEEFNKIGKQDFALVKTLKLYEEGERDALQLAKVLAEAEPHEAGSFRKQVDERVGKENETTLKKNRFLRQVVAAEQGNAASQFNLGLMYDTGESVTQDYQEAVRWYRLAAEQGYANAQFNLAVMYAKGYGVAQDYQEAIRLYQALAEQGEADAQTRLGLMYEKGQGVTQDYQEAMRWYRFAAAQGDADAQFILARMHDYGEGVTQDYQEAVRWYQFAAEYGNSLALGRLGLMYYQGQDVPKDYVKAYMWFNLAEKDGVKLGLAIRETLDKEMTPEQIAEAQRMAQEWKPKGK